MGSVRRTTCASDVPQLEPLVRTAPITPTSVERTFGAEEIIVSKTDLKGRIAYANDVFIRVSGYRRSELLGKPHSIIRHPDMPRAVFQKLWDTLRGGEEMFAYVKNLTPDGAYYWVLAHVTPSFRDGQAVGYHSNRRLPAPGAVREIDELYQVLVREERRHGSGNQAVAASSALLKQMLEDRDMTYDEYVWDVINRHGGQR